MGMCPDDFDALTPARFMYAWIGWMDMEENRTKQEWERQRWAVWILTSIQMDRKDRQPMSQMFPLPWEATPTEATDLSMDERLERVNQILNRTSDET